MQIQSSPDIFQSIPAKPLQNLRKSALAGGAKSFEHAMHGGCATCSLTCSRPSSYCRALAQSDYQLQSNSNEQVSYCTATSPRASIPSHNITRSKMEHRSQANRTASTSLAVVATIAGLICTYVALSNNHSISMRAFAADYDGSNVMTSSSSSPVAQMTARRGRRRLMDEVDDVKEKDQGAVHSQCARGNPKDLKERPLLIFKYSRTGSTWLAWTGNTVKLASGKNMVWTHEATKCDKDRDETTKTATAAGTVEWLKEYFGHETDGKLINEPNRHVPRSEGGMQSECLQNAGEDADNIGVTIATLNPHESHVETPDLSDEEWGDIFGADPNLAMGVLVRTNSVKRAISAIASHKQLALCGRKKLTGGEDCIKNLPKTINLNVTELWSKIHESEMKRAIVTEAAGELANKFGDGRIFCLSYESMQQGEKD